MSKFNAGKASILAITGVLAVAAFLLGKVMTTPKTVSADAACYEPVDKIITEVAYDDPTTYTCNNGDSLNGQTCSHTTTDTVGANHVGGSNWTCPEGYIGPTQNHECTKTTTTTYTATSHPGQHHDAVYGCPAGSEDDKNGGCQTEITCPSTPPGSCKVLNAECDVNDSNKACCTGLTCVPFNANSGNGKCETSSLDCNENQYENDGECVNKTPVCTDVTATNYDSNFNEGTEVSDPKECQYGTRRWCSPADNDSGFIAIAVPTNQYPPDDGGKPWVTGMDRYCVIAPTPTPNPDVCDNIDGIQYSVPDGLHLDAGGRNCVSFSVPGPGGNPGNGGGQVLGASTTQGQVLGASTMAGTGTFDETLYSAIMSIGATLSAFGLKGLKKAKKTSKK